MKTYAHKKTYTGMFTVTSFIKPPMETQNVPAGEWKNKLCYIQTAEYNSEMKRNDVWYKMDILWKKNYGKITWSERSQAKTNVLYNLFNINSIKCVLIYNDKKQFTGWIKG